MSDIKKTMDNAVYAFKNVEIAKHYDCSTSFRDKKTGKHGMEIAFKGDFSITPIQILAVGIVAACVCAGCAIKKKLGK